MNFKRLNIFALLALLTFGVSCKKLSEVVPAKEDELSTANPNSEVNSWIYDQMKQYYLWEGQMKAKNSTDNTKGPDDYFESLLVEPGVLDRFSWIEEDVEELTASLNGINKVVGIRFTPFYTNSSNTKVALSIAYALKGSPADKAGLKRGDLIIKVNGNELTPENYGTAFSSDNLEFTLADYVNGEIVSNSKTAKVTKAEVQTDPIQYSTVLTYGTKKIGYFVYLQFLTSFNTQMRQVFADFKAKGVNELVLDLRYNGGGYISASDILSSLIVKDLKANTLMSRQEWNPAMTTAYKSRYGNNVFDSYWLNEGNNLGTLSKVYVLTSKSTASASELVINNLKPYMDVILIGDNTYGKNVGSITISDDKKRWKWGMQPIVLRTLNAAGQSDYGTSAGFTPNFKVTDNVIPYKPFGDPTETLLSKAIEQIVGVPVATLHPQARIGVSKAMKMLTPRSLTELPSQEITDMYVDKLPKL